VSENGNRTHTWTYTPRASGGACCRCLPGLAFSEMSRSCARRGHGCSVPYPQRYARPGRRVVACALQPSWHGLSLMWPRWGREISTETHGRRPPARHTLGRFPRDLRQPRLEQYISSPETCSGGQALSKREPSCGWSSHRERIIPSVVHPVHEGVRTSRRHARCGVRDLGDRGHGWQAITRTIVLPKSNSKRRAAPAPPGTALVWTVQDNGMITRTTGPNRQEF